MKGRLKVGRNSEESKQKAAKKVVQDMRCKNTVIQEIKFK